MCVFNSAAISYAILFSVLYGTVRRVFVSFVLLWCKMIQREMILHQEYLISFDMDVRV